MRGRGFTRGADMPADMIGRNIGGLSEPMPKTPQPLTSGRSKPKVSQYPAVLQWWALAFVCLHFRIPIGAPPRCHTRRCPIKTACLGGYPGLGRREGGPSSPSPLARMKCSRLGLSTVAGGTRGRKTSFGTTVCTGGPRPGARWGWDPVGYGVLAALTFPSLILKVF